MFKINSGTMKFIALFLGIILILMIPFSSALAASQGQEGAPPGFNFSEFFKVAKENGGYILAMVIGYNTILGMFGVAGKWQSLSGMLLGLFIGGAFQIAGLGIPKNFAEGFAIFAYGSLMGLAAIGLYETGKKIGTKVVTDLVAQLINQPPVQ